MSVARRCVWVGLGALCVALGAACCSSYYYELTTENPVVRLPLDEAPHCSGNEWWYYTGKVTTTEGKEYGIEAVIFHTADLPPVRVGEAYVAHYAVLDVSTGKFAYNQGISVPTSISPSYYPGFDLTTPLIQMKGLGGQDHVQAAMSDGSFALSLDLDDVRGPILHGGTGYVDYGKDGKSFYYSRPEMTAAGTLLVGDRLHNVTGTMWFDRQWGKDLDNPWLKWDWFSIRLDDGACIMVFMFRDETSPVAMGTYVPAEGDAFTLNSDDFTITPTATWTSPYTDGDYPTSWRIQIPRQGLDLTIQAVAKDQEVDSRWTTLNVYWEGLCAVGGTRDGHAVTGDCYVEMTNRAKFSLP